MDLAAGLSGTDLLQMRSWHVMFMARGKVGPFRVDAEAVPSPDGKIGVRLAMHDEGNEGRAVTSASAMFDIVR
jgi:hypothetical protein